MLAYLQLGTATIAQADVVTLADTGTAAMGMLSVADVAGLAAKGVDKIDTTDNILSLTTAKYTALGTVGLTAADAVTLTDTGANIAALTAAQFGGLTAKGVDAIDAIGDVLTLTVAQCQALGSVALTAADFVTLADTAANIATLTSADLAALSAKGVDSIETIDSNPTELLLNPSFDNGASGWQYSNGTTISGGKAALPTGWADVFQLNVNGGLTAGVTYILGMYVSSVTNASTIHFGIGDDPDSSHGRDWIVNLGAETTLGETSPGLIERTFTITATHTDYSLYAYLGGATNVVIDYFSLRVDSGSVQTTTPVTVAQYLALGASTFPAADIVTLTDTSANIASLTTSQIGALAGKGVDKIDATDNILSADHGQIPGARNGRTDGGRCSHAG